MRVRGTVWIWILILQSLLQGDEVPSVCAPDTVSTEQAGLLREFQVVEDIVEDGPLYFQYTNQNKKDMFAYAVPLSEIGTCTGPFSRQSHIVNILAGRSQNLKIPTLEAIVATGTHQKQALIKCSFESITSVHLERKINGALD